MRKIIFSNKHLAVQNEFEGKDQVGEYVEAVTKYVLVDKCHLGYKQEVMTNSFIK